MQGKLYLIWTGLFFIMLHDIIALNSWVKFLILQILNLLWIAKPIFLIIKNKLVDFIVFEYIALFMFIFHQIKY